MRLCLGFAFLIVCLTGLPASAEQEVLRLWEGDAPLATSQTPKDIPTLTIYPAAKPNGCGIVVCPGGGYGGLAVGHEGVDIANWLNKQGVSAFVLRYRVKPYKHPVPMLDVSRAVRTVRHQHKKFGIDPNRLGVMGFSAGGHLASTIATHFDSGDEQATDPIEQTDCRPDFVVLGYPVITMDPSFTHAGSRRNLLGEDPDEELVELMSNDTQVTQQTPPTFVWHTQEDHAVPVENSLAFYMALVEAGVPSELHVYPKGRHGIGLGRDVAGASAWPAACITWMKAGGWLTPAKQAAAGATP